MERQSVLQEFVGTFFATSLDLVATELIVALWCEPDVTHDRYVSPRQELDMAATFWATLQLEASLTNLKAMPGDSS